MDKFVMDCLKEIAVAAQLIETSVGKVIGWSSVAEQWRDWQSNEPPPPVPYTDNRVQRFVSLPAVGIKPINEIIEEVKQMIIELKITGSVREHRNGLLKFTSVSLGCVYGRTKEEIEEKLKEKIKQLNDKPRTDKKQKVKVKAPLLSEYYEKEYIPYKKRQNLASSSLTSIDCLFRFLLSQNFDKRITEYKPKEIEDFLFSIPQTRKRQKMQGLLNNMFTRAATLGIVKTNPCNSLEKVQHKQEQGKAFSFDEQTEFFKTLFASDHLTYTQKCYFIFLYLTGARRSEALSVKVEDVDFKNSVLSIRGTKTEGSNRQIPLTPLVEKLLLSLNPKRGIYFPINENMIDKYFRAIWGKEKGHKTHDLRHTFGTIQICAEKIDVKTVSLCMGHTTINTTVNIYTHPEQLDCGIFLRGDLSNEEKTAIYREKYSGVLMLIETFLGKK